MSEFVAGFAQAWGIVLNKAAATNSWKPGAAATRAIDAMPTTKSATVDLTEPSQSVTRPKAGDSTAPPAEANVTNSPTCHRLRANSSIKAAAKTPKKIGGNVAVDMAAAVTVDRTVRLVPCMLLKARSTSVFVRNRRRP